MKIKRIRKLKVNSFEFEVIWNKNKIAAEFNYVDRRIEIGVNGWNDDELFMIVCHELQEICACEMNVRFRRPDCDTDYIFVYDHRQHETMTNMFAGLVSQFIA